VASDFIATALACNEPSEAVEAAEFVLSVVKDDLSPLYRLAQSCLDPVAAPVAYATEEGVAPESRLHVLRQLVRQYPRNAIAHMDIARLYCLLGQHKQSEESVRMALQLAPLDRYVIRSASRYFVHVGKDEEAYRLVHSPSKHTDPWLVSVELAISSRLDISPASWKAAKRIIARNQPSFHTSELRAAFATHLLDGSTRKARKIFAESVISPTENTVAQIQWVHQNVMHLDSALEFDMYRRSSEASARRFFVERNFVASLHAAVQWFDLEPFSIAAAGFTTFVASTFAHDFRLSREVAQRALVANPESFLLWNNRAFAEVCLGDTASAQQSIANALRAVSDGMDRAVLDATQGLFELKLGNVELAQRLHDQAREYFRSERDFDRELIAMYCWCMAKAGTATNAELAELKRKSAAASKSRVPYVVLLREKIQELLNASPLQGGEDSTF
jgi:tetratricopeptide (TPR) repeat protein